MIMAHIAYAQAASGGGESVGLTTNIIMLVMIFAVFYFLLIRPQQRRQKQHQEMLKGLAVDDEVVSAGGIIGRITKIGANAIAVDIGNGVIMHFQRQSIQVVLPKGTIDNL